MNSRPKTNKWDACRDTVGLALRACRLLPPRERRLEPTERAAARTGWHPAIHGLGCVCNYPWCFHLGNFALGLALVLMALPVIAATGTPRELVVYSEDFNLSHGDWTVVGRTSWALGRSTKFPPGIDGPELVWGTGLSENYGPNEDGAVMSPVIDLSKQPAGTTFRLNWRQVLRSEPDYDSASVEVSKDGGATWTRIYGKVSGAVSPEWSRQSVSLDASWSSPLFRVRFRFQSDTSRNDFGFAIDDVEIVRVRNDFEGTGFDGGGGHGLTEDESTSFEFSFTGFVSSPPEANPGQTGIRLVPGLMALWEDAEVVSSVVLPRITRIELGSDGQWLLTIERLADGTKYQFLSASTPSGPWSTQGDSFSPKPGTATAQISLRMPPLDEQAYFRVQTLLP